MPRIIEDQLRTASFYTGKVANPGQLPADFSRGGINQQFYLVVGYTQGFYRVLFENPCVVFGKIDIDLLRKSGLT